MEIREPPKPNTSQGKRLTSVIGCPLGPLLASPGGPPSHLEAVWGVLESAWTVFEASRALRMFLGFLAAHYGALWFLGEPVRTPGRPKTLCKFAKI
eukprot:6442508-Pyramimonas_sp.AAC.1